MSEETEARHEQTEDSPAASQPEAGRSPAPRSSNPPVPHANQGDRSIAGRKPDDFVFEPRESSFGVITMLTLRSTPVQKAFSRTFERTALALFEADLIIPIIASEDSQAREVLSVIDKAITAVSTWIEGEIDRATEVIGINEIRIDGEFSKPMQITRTIYSPRTKRLIDLFGRMDALMELKSKLFWGSFMDPVSHKRASFDARVKMTRLARSIWEIHTRSLQTLRRLRVEAEEAASKEHDEYLRRKAAARAARAATVLATIEARESSDSDEVKDDPFGQRELEGELGTTIEEADQAITATRVRRSRKAAPAAAAN